MKETETVTTDLNPDRLTELIDTHLKLTRRISTRLIKSGKKETSTVISHRVIIVDGASHLESTINILPVRRMYKDSIGEIMLGDDTIMFEMAEEIE